MRGQRFEEVLRNCREGSPLELTPEELAEGWHYCPEFEGQLTLQRVAGGNPWCGCSQSKDSYIWMSLNDYADEVHKANAKWWIDIETGEPLKRNKGEMQMLIVSEIAEAMEGVRKDLMDDKLPHRKMEEVEMADALIRILDYCAGHGLDIDGAYREKMAYNARRADHQVEHRKMAGGKKF